MKKQLLLSLLLLLVVLLGSTAGAAEVRDLTWTELQAQMRNKIEQNLIVEFYSSESDALECDRCREEEAVFVESASSYGEEIAFVRVDVSAAPFLIGNGTVSIYPTHLFVRHKIQPDSEIVARRIKGFLSKTDFESLIREFFETGSN